MSTFVLIVVTSLGLAGLYFLLAAGLSLIFGLMNVLNLAHGAFFGIGGYAAWLTMDRLEVVSSLGLRFLVAVLVAAVVGLVVGALVERLLIARSYDNHLGQILLTIGLGFALVALLGGVFSYDAQPLVQPAWFGQTTELLGARIPNSRLLILAVAVVLLAALLLFLAKTRHGLVIRAGVENRSMVEALGIDVSRSFTLVFALGGLLAAVGGALGAVYFNGISPALGTTQLIFAFIVVVIGGLGSVTGTALSAVVVALTQQLINFYGAPGLGDIAVVGLLAAVLLLRPQGLLGAVAR
ncbi:branched-chain amino acid ABC transporter permease [Blastococcus goldschmidtiae]|uniref:Branched-chain amino acid ABC transporter permease n=1 Tax=Blastococcus goldschmidtiae TaxID=3075546 RepID=A0ABU2K7N9_9ACTN|nr:branched-chain amino acid ABC transporter permease [Blastococcus sp. DSM 46792]MDT0276203.1 branched-chain amino acid ABC transporter permease [Blastococcus sp. DSM 46792]